MKERFLYRWEDVKAAVKCSTYLASRGIELKNERCAAFWRGGKNAQSVHVDDAKGAWHDFATGEGGSVIDLCAVVECNGDRLKALNILGEKYRVAAFQRIVKAHRSYADRMLSDGYNLVVTYKYLNEDGSIAYFVDRFEKTGDDGKKVKSFGQRTPDHDGLDGVKRVLYNLPAVMTASMVFVAEGEKDCETLRSFGLVATTNSGGASNWSEDFTMYFAGKDVVILCDNDEPGQKHGQILNSFIRPVAKSCKVITPSRLPKGDVTDWVEREGGSLQALMDIIKKTDADAVKADRPELARAKLANQNPFSNYIEGSKRSGNLPRGQRELVKEVHDRFLGYPRMLGSVLFDYAKDSGEVVYLNGKNDIFAWIQNLSKHNVRWMNSSDGFVSRDELFCALQQCCRKYSGMSCAPHFPTRDDVFYTHDAFPVPDATHSSFWRMIDFFCPADAANRTLIAMLFITPIFYMPTASRPLIIIDTDDAQGSGKTTLVKMVSHLYGQAPITIDLGQLNKDQDQIIKRLISSEGRRSRIVLIDNVIGTLKSPALASLVTQSIISGRPAYGRGEENRPNDLTYVVTMNGAQLDSDIASRSYTIRIKAPKDPNPCWESDVYAFISDNRNQILSDILHMLQNNPLKGASRRKSRFGMFDSIVLSAVCNSREEFDAVDAAIRNESNAANEDGDRAQEFVELLKSTLSNAVNEGKIRPDVAMYIRSSDIDYILSQSDGALKKWSSGEIRQLVRQGLVKGCSKTITRLHPPKGSKVGRYRGFLFGEIGQDKTLVQYIVRKGSSYGVEDIVSMEIKERS